MQSSQNEALKQKTDLLKEVDNLRGELQQVRDDRDHKLAEIHSLLADVSTYKEMTGKSVSLFDNAMTRSTVLDVCSCALIDSMSNYCYQCS